MRKEVIENFFNKTNISSYVNELYNTVLADAIVDANNGKDAMDAPTDDVVNNMEQGTYIVFNNNDEKEEEDILLAELSNSFPRNRVDAAKLIDKAKKEVSSDINIKNISKDNIYIIENDKKEMLFITTLIEKTIRQNNLYERDTFVGNEGVSTFFLSTFVEEFHICHPISVMKNEEVGRYGIAPSDIYFMTDADSGYIISIWSTTYGMIAKFDGDITLEDFVYHDDLITFIDSIINNIKNSQNESVETKATDNGNKIQH